MAPTEKAPGKWKPKKEGGVSQSHRPKLGRVLTGAGKMVWCPSHMNRTSAQPAPIQVRVLPHSITLPCQLQRGQVAGCPLISLSPGQTFRSLPCSLCLPCPKIEEPGNINPRGFHLHTLLPPGSTPTRVCLAPQNFGSSLFSCSPWEL